MTVTVKVTVGVLLVVDAAGVGAKLGLLVLLAVRMSPSSTGKETGA